MDYRILALCSRGALARGLMASLVAETAARGLSGNFGDHSATVWTASKALVLRAWEDFDGVAPGMYDELHFIDWLQADIDRAQVQAWAKRPSGQLKVTKRPATPTASELLDLLNDADEAPFLNAPPATRRT